ncbi:hypothetical protein ApAK_02120 [Thermoplasmatales archaeon AK]|nr:hypothetical protein [Thermoplasmatales archaeon AK]
MLAETGETRIVQYLVDTFHLRDVVEQIEPLEKNSSNPINLLAPWEFRTVCLNASVSDQFLRQFVKKSRTLSLQRVKQNGVELELIKANGEIHNPAPIDVIDSNDFTVKELMNLHMYLFLAGNAGVPKPVKIEDALFNLKNSVFLPDDFMPEHLMGNVGGSMLLPKEALFSEFQLFGHSAMIYIFPEDLNSKFSRVRYLLPSGPHSVRGISQESIVSALKESFSQLSGDPLYRKFEASRLIKTIVFNLNRKKQVELRPPLFTPEKVKILSEFGIITSDNRLNPSLDADKLSKIASDLKNQSSALAQRWFNSKVVIKVG